MTRLLPLALLFASTPAWATDYFSEQQPVRFSGKEAVIDSSYTLPFGTALDLWINEFWIGVVVTLKGSSIFELGVEGMSDVAWSDDDGRDGVIYQQLSPLEGSGEASFESSAGFQVTFDVWEGGEYGVGRRYLNFNLLASGVQFELTSEPFTPFLLPGDPVGSQTLSTRSNQMGFNVPLMLPIGLGGLVNLKVGAILRGHPEADATFAGISLDTVYVEGGSLISVGANQPGEIVLLEPQPVATFESSYEAFVASSINYVFNADLAFELELIDLFSFPITIPIYEWVVPLFFDDRDIGFTTEQYQHPLPMFTPGTHRIDFGTVEVGSSDSFTFAVNNDGNMDLVGTVSVVAADAPVFTASPNGVAVGAGGQAPVVVTFAPTQPGEYQARLVFDTNDPFLERREILLVGKAVVPGAKGPNDDLPGDFTPTNPGTSIYTTCGCASTAPSTSWLPLVGLVPLVAARRRRPQA